MGRRACLPRQVVSNPDTGIVFGLRIFTAHQSGPWITGRTPEGPLVQDSLSGPDRHNMTAFMRLVLPPCFAHRWLVGVCFSNFS